MHLFILSAYPWIIDANSIHFGARGVGIATGEILHSLGLVIESRRNTQFWRASRYASSNVHPVTLTDSLGIPLHPAHRKIAKLLDSFEDGQYFSIFAEPPRVVPSTSYLTHGYPFALLRHILTLLPRPQPTAEDLPSSCLENDVRLSEETVSQQEASLRSVDNRKWHWPHYLTFSGKMKPNQNAGVLPPETLEKREDEPTLDKPQLSEVDEGALEDAMSTITIPALSQSANATPTQSVSDSRAKVESDHQTETPQSDDTNPLAVSESVPELQTTFVHLSEPTSPLLTARRPLHYFIVSFTEWLPISLSYVYHISQDDQRLFIVVPLREDVFATGTELATKVATFFERLEEISEDDALLRFVTAQIRRCSMQAEV